MFCQDSPLNQLLFSASMTSFHTAYLPAVSVSGTSFPNASVTTRISSPRRSWVFQRFDHQTSLYSLLRLPYKVSHDHFLHVISAPLLLFVPSCLWGPVNTWLNPSLLAPCLHVEAKCSLRRHHFRANLLQFSSLSDVFLFTLNCLT